MSIQRGKCKSCGADILFVTTEATGKAMPLDPAPVQYGGNVVILEGKCRILKKDEPVMPDVKRFRSHFVTCPAQKAHRKPKGRKKAAKIKKEEPPTLF